MHDQQAPWPFLAFVLLVFGGFGAALLFFADHILDWQIRMLQARWYRRFTRGFGLFVLAFAILLAGMILYHSKL